ncbi:hypothetical protein QN277_006159 [Acacia crassicarpa]|uniref:RING-type domain-containing protein n=1 Tax=Acacia crassicarpa TaxID=499986 RepID=A0AAE1MH18_9FABA|nr:hypothetical protein QN277_006159 [Acacia crassicarpa]
MASSQIEFASSTSPFGCINHHHQVTPAKNLFNHFVRDPLKNNTTTNNANNNLGTLRFESNRREEQGESSSSSVNPSHEEPSPSSSPPPSLFPSQSPSFRKRRPSTIFVPSDFSPGDNVSNLGASSLVQIWEKRLNQSPLNTTKSSSTPKSSPNTTTSSSSSPQSSSSEEEADSPQGQIHHHRSETSILRVADIIKRLTATSSEDIANNNNQDHQNHCVGSPENRSLVINSPRIRGRQAFNDLLMQVERDRHDELSNLADCAPVSNFPYRGRIQSLLRLRLMQRGIVAKDYQHSFPSTTSQVTKKLPQRSIIMCLRERFGTGIKNKATASIEVVEHETPGREKENKASPIYNIPPNPTGNPVSHTGHNNKEEEEEEVPPCSDALVPSLEAQNAKTSSSSMADMNVEPLALEKYEDIEEKYNNVYDEMEEEEEGGSEEEEHGESVYEEIEEVEINYGSETDNFDWISQISKPKSYWEDLRQAWYKEMLDNNESQKDDICQLLQRRTVSNFLCSDFRDKMDNLMESHKGTQANVLASQDDNERNHYGKIGHKLVAILQQQLNNNPSKRDKEEDDIKAEADKEEEEEQEEEEEEEEEEIVISSSYNGESDSMNQSSPSQPSQSPSFFLHTHQNSSPSCPPSIEMELIYDLRGHMKQLYQEMSELRNSIRSCIDMQIILQKSLNHSAKGKKSRDRILKKGNCRVCSNMKADSLFYRCGHMCTCLKCANELQQKNGMCPICEAPIVDVVRVYVDA